MPDLIEICQLHQCAFLAPLYEQVSNQLYSNPSGVPRCVELFLLDRGSFKVNFLPFMSFSYAELSTFCPMDAL